MVTKDKIVERLLENKTITTEEAVILLKEKTNLQEFKQFPVNLLPPREVPYHTICGCDICHCVMANKMVNPDSSGNFNIDTTYTTSNNINGGINGNGESQQEYFGK